MQLPLLSLSLWLATGSGVLASFQGNINYGSPSRRDIHAGLGIDTAIIEQRHERNRRKYLSRRDGNDTEAPLENLSFTHGVASGDPWPESVMLWTRVAPSTESDCSDKVVSGTAILYNHERDRYINEDKNPICVEWKVFEANEDGSEPDESRVVATDKAYTTSDIDFTVKIEAGGLKPLTSYNYQFTVCNTDTKSPMGRTKTAPGADDDVEKLRFAVFSCSNYPNGYFNPYGNAARRNEHDFVVHLGDYIYEDAATSERSTTPNKTLFTLHDYRTRHGQYRTDPDLQLLSKDFAWIPTWDDHDFANNVYRDGFKELKNSEESFRKGDNVSVDSRKVNAVRSYFEWMPIRQTDPDDGLRVWRSFKMGKLLDLVVIDTRGYDRSAGSMGQSEKNDSYIDLIRDDPSRTLMGQRQEQWFYRSMSESKERGAKWRVVANQIIFSRVFDNDEGLMDADNWNGYVANRNRTLQHLYDEEVGNNIFLAGDSHESWVSDLVWLGEKEYNGETGEGAIGVEFAGTAVSSTGQEGAIEPTVGDYSRAYIERNVEMQWQEGYYRGYFILTVTPEEATAQFYGSPSVATRNPWEIPLANFSIRADENHLSRPVAGGRVESGALRNGSVEHTNNTLNTETGEWEVKGFDKMYLDIVYHE